ncbi:MAG: hypothetical protein Rubg2KO_31970 [Rubricoccaceae bacterium]
MTRFYILTAVVLSLSLTACDSGGPDLTTANVTLTAQSVRALGDCDDASKSEYQIQVAILDSGNNPVADLALQPQTTYGVWPGGANAATNYVWLLDGETATFDESLSFQRPLDGSGGFAVVASAIEWDANGDRDARMDDVSSVKSHPYSNGVFEDIVGTQTVRVRGDRSCDLVITYGLTVQ